MRKIVFCLVVLSFVSGEVDAQLRKSAGGGRQRLKVRHVQGAKGFELGAGISGYGIYGAGYFSEFFKDNLYYKVGAGYEFRPVAVGDTRYSSAFADGLIGITVLDKGSVFVNGFAGGTVAYDMLDGLVTDKKTNGVGYGAVLGGEFEFYVANGISFLLVGSQRFIFSKEFGDRYYFGGAFRFKL